VGQQQLLLIILGVIIVGVAIVMGINLFHANAVEAKRNNITNELVNLASHAQQFFMKPTALGGGSRSFTEWKIPDELVTTANGHFTIESIKNDEVQILGVGNEVVTGNDSVKVRINVKATTFQTNIVN
jgi:hypothetical protein